MNEVERCKEYWDKGYWQYIINNNRIKDADDVLSEKYAEYLSQTPSKRALDVGCGLGQDTKYLLAHGFEVISSDLSKTALAKMAELVPGATVLEHDTTERFPFEDESFGLILANLSLHYFDWETTEKVFAEMRRLLAPGGLLIGRVNSNKSSWYEHPDAEGVDKLEEDFFWDGQKFRRFFSQEQFDKLSPGWKIEVLREDVIARLNDDKKAIWEFVWQK